MRPPNPFRLSVVVAVSLFALPALAQDEASVSASANERTHPSGEIFGARIRYGVVMREGSQDDNGPGLSYDGLTPNDVALQLTYFPIDVVGAEVSLQREGFSLNGDSGRVTSGSLLRAHAGPKARVKFGPLKIEALAGFQYAQLPSFASTTGTPDFRAGSRQAVLLAAKLSVDIFGGLSAFARADYPVFSLSASDGSGAAARSTGLAAGGGLAYTIGWADKLSYGVVLDYQYVTDRLEATNASTPLVSAQTLQRIGGGLEVQWNDAPPGPPPPQFGGLLVSVVDDATGAPLPDATVSLEQEGETKRSVKTGADGTAKASQLPPGTAVARVSVGGYLPSEAQGNVVAGQDGRVEVRAKKEPPKVGGLIVTVTNKDGDKPIEGAVVLVGDKELLTAADGTAKIEGLNPGPVEIKVTAKGFQDGNEAARVTAGRDSAVPIQLVEAQKKVPATITGLVRNTRGGAPIAADLEIPELKLKTRADDKGAFSMRVPGGTYSVIISAQGFITQQKSVTVKDGDQAIFNVDMFPGRNR